MRTQQENLWKIPDECAPECSGNFPAVVNGCPPVAFGKLWTANYGKCAILSMSASGITRYVKLRTCNQLPAWQLAKICFTGLALLSRGRRGVIWPRHPPRSHLLFIVTAPFIRPASLVAVCHPHSPRSRLVVNNEPRLYFATPHCKNTYCNPPESQGQREGGTVEDRQTEAGWLIGLVANGPLRCWANNHQSPKQQQIRCCVEYTVRGDAWPAVYRGEYCDEGRGGQLAF